MRLARNGIPQIAVIMTFELMNTQTEGYRWTRVEVGIREIVSKPQLRKAIDTRAQISSLVPRLRLQSQKITN